MQKFLEFFYHLIWSYKLSGGVVLIFLMQDVKERTEKEWGCWSLNWSRDEDFGNESSWVMSHGDIGSSTLKCEHSWLAFSVPPIVLTKKSFF